MNKLEKYFKNMPEDILHQTYSEIMKFFNTGDLRDADNLKQIRRNIERDNLRYDYPMRFICQAAFEEMAKRWYGNYVCNGR